MTDEDNASTGWFVGIAGSLDNPENEVITVTRDDPPHIRLEIAAPNLLLSEGDQNQIVRKLVQDAAIALQQALDSPSALPGLHLKQQ